MTVANRLRRTLRRTARRTGQEVIVRRPSNVTTGGAVESTHTAQTCLATSPIPIQNDGSGTAQLEMATVIVLTEAELFETRPGMTCDLLGQRYSITHADPLPVAGTVIARTLTLSRGAA